MYGLIVILIIALCIITLVGGIFVIIHGIWTDNLIRDYQKMYWKECANNPFKKIPTIEEFIKDRKERKKK